jgi:competence protein ComFB
MKLRNLMEDAVAYAIVDLHKSCDFCSCEQCRLDILALALNQLPPRYVVTDLGDTYSRADMLETQKEVDILGAVLNAVNVVRQHPRHKE